MNPKLDIVGLREGAVGRACRPVRSSGQHEKSGNEPRGELEGATAPHRPEGDTLAVATAAGLEVLETAVEEIQDLAGRHDGRALLAGAELIERVLQGGGRVHVTGVGKPEHVAHYAASLLSSTGTPTSFLHAAELLHGGLGQLVPGDVVIAISNSGETPELLRVVTAIASYGGQLIAVTGDMRSRLAELAEVVIDAAVSREGGPLGLAPRSSVLAETLVLAALGALLQDRSGFGRADYAARHPAGALGTRAR